MDEMYKAAVQEPDIAKRAGLERQIGQWFYDNYWTVPIAVKNSMWAVGKKVGKWETFPGQAYVQNLEYVSHGD